MRVYVKVWGGCLLACGMVAFAAAGAEANAQGDQNAARASKALPATIVTSNGKIYQSVKLLGGAPDGLSVEFSPAEGGIGFAKIKFRDLPESLRQQFDFDPDKASDYEIEQGKALAQWRSDLEAAEAEAAKKRAEETMIEQPTAPSEGALPSGRFQVSATIAGAIILDTLTGEAWLADLHSTIVPQDYTVFLLPKVSFAGLETQRAPRNPAELIKRGY